jgi:membrane associated rhomboid family serine protease
MKIYLRYPATLSSLLIDGLAVWATFGSCNPVAILGWHRATGANWPLSLFSAHFVHLGVVHLALNLLAALSIGWTCDRLYLAGRLPMAALASLLGIDLGLLYGPWQIDWYVGLSGILHGLFAWLTLTLAISPPIKFAPSVRVLAAILFVTGLAKVVTGLSVPVGMADWRGVPLATPVHVYGYFAGAFWAGLHCARLTRPIKPARPKRA